MIWPSRPPRSAEGLRRHGSSRIRDLEPPTPVLRYERERPGEPIHVAIEKLGRFERTGRRITGASARVRARAVGSDGSTCTWPPTIVRGWVQARACDTSDQRAGGLPVFLFRDNRRRPHMGIDRQTPIGRLGPFEDDLSMLHTSLILPTGGPPATTGDPGREDLFADIEGYCNRPRIDSALGHIPPERAERSASQTPYP